MQIKECTLDNISDDLRRFIKEYYESYYNKPLLINLKSDTEIENDLGITGDDADDFLTALVKRYNLDYSKFDGRKYFGYEHESFDFFFPILRFIFGNRKWLPLPKDKREKLTIGMLEESVRTGKLM